MANEILTNEQAQGFPIIDDTNHRLLMPKEINLTGITHEHFNSNPQQVLPTLNEGTMLQLYPDLTNEYDKYAIAVMTEDNRYIGWLPKESTDIHKRLINGNTLYCRLNRVYQFDNGNYGAEVVIAMYAMQPSTGAQLKRLKSAAQQQSKDSVPKQQQPKKKNIGCLPIFIIAVLFLWSIGRLTGNTENQVTVNSTAEIATEEFTVNSNYEGVSEVTTIAAVEHRTGTEIVGISNKDISNLNPNYYDHVNNDVTGNWRYLSIAQNGIIPEEYALSIYNQYFDNDSNVIAVVNFSTKTTTCINCMGNILSVDTYEYVDGEEHDAKLLFTGMKYSSSWVYLDNGDIETIE
jgi:hypothetical protein